MEVTFNRNDLLEAMRKVDSIVSRYSSMPVLNNVLIESSDMVQLVATDLEISLKLTVPGEVIDAGRVTIPAKKLYDIVRELPNATIKMYLLPVKSHGLEWLHCQQMTFHRYLNQHKKSY